MGIFFTILLGNIEVSYLEVKISHGHKPAINHCHCENMVTVPSLVREIRTLVEIHNFTKRGNGTFDPKTSQSTDKLLNNKMKCRNMEKTPIRYQNFNVNLHLQNSFACCCFRAKRFFKVPKKSCFLAPGILVHLVMSNWFMLISFSSLYKTMKSPTMKEAFFLNHKFLKFKLFSSSI